MLAAFLLQPRICVLMNSPSSILKFSRVSFQWFLRVAISGIYGLQIVNNMGNLGRSGLSRKPNKTMRLFVTSFAGVIFGFLLGASFMLSLSKINLTANLIPSLNQQLSNGDRTSSTQSQNSVKIWEPSNPKEAERLPPGIIVAESDFYLHKLWGNPSEDLTTKSKYLVAFTVGYNQKNNIDAAIKKFSDDFTVVLFHYDGRTTEWDKSDWSKRAIHISAPKQTKWWFAKRFLHPDIVAAYEYIFIWDEDLGVEHFDAEEYIKLVKKYGLEISQPGLESNKPLTWNMTRRRADLEVHKQTEEKPGWCEDPRQPPCAAFVEIMAPVFSRSAWRCVWHMIQNDLIHGWGLDFALRKCVEPAHEKIGVVDAQWVVHQGVPSLGNQGQSPDGQAPWRGVRERCMKEWKMFQKRLSNAESAHSKVPS